jgi:hypothetical protein
MGENCVDVGLADIGNLPFFEKSADPSIPNIVLTGFGYSSRKMQFFSQLDCIDCWDVAGCLPLTSSLSELGWLETVGEFLGASWSSNLVTPIFFTEPSATISQGLFFCSPRPNVVQQRSVGVGLTRGGEIQNEMGAN